VEAAVTKHPSDRRAFHRAGAVEQRIVSARVRPGHPAAVIDISAGGAFIEISRRLLPGSSVDLQMDTAQRRTTTLRGQVLRCAVVRLRPASVWYRAAIAFDHQCPWLGDGTSAEYSVPAREASPPRDERVVSTQGPV
jgi:hypothetical protein